MANHESLTADLRADADYKPKRVVDKVGSRHLRAWDNPESQEPGVVSRKQVFGYVTVELADAIAARAKKTNRTISYVVSEALSAYFNLPQ